MKLILLNLIFILAGIGAEVIGFGISSISMALLPLVLPFSTSIPLVAIISLIATGKVAYTTKAKNIGKALVPLFVGSLLGIPLGLFFLEIAKKEHIFLILGLLLVFSSMYSLSGKDLNIKTSKISGVIVGFIAGLLGGAINVNGALIGMYFSQDRRNSKVRNKDLITTYMFFTGLITVIGHYVAGRLTNNVIYSVLFSLPSLFIGMWIGKIIFKKISNETLRIFIYLFIVIAGMKLIFDSISISSGLL